MASLCKVTEENLANINPANFNEDNNPKKKLLIAAIRVLDNQKNNSNLPQEDDVNFQLGNLSDNVGYNNRNK